MVMDVISDSSLGPLWDAMSNTIEAIIEMIVASNNILINKKSFSQLASYLQRLNPILSELARQNDAIAPEGLANFIHIIDHEIKEAKKLVTEYRERSRFYLFVNSRSIAKSIERITREISRALSCIPWASANILLNVREDINELISRIENAEFKAAVEEEEILDRIELGINERNVNRAYADNLLVSIAKAIGVPTDRSALKKEFDEFRGELDNLWSRKDKAEAIQMDQIIALLERADAASSFEDRQKNYLTKRESLGACPLEPLESFFCPITQEVMVDPVETPSGQTFDRGAIERCLSPEVNGPICPLTSTPLEVSMLRPNKTLRQLIEEWKERNTMIVVGSLRSRLSSGVEEEVIRALDEMKGLCEEREIHKEWLILENYVPNLVGLLVDKNREIKQRALLVLCLLVKDNNDAMQRIANIEDSVSRIVQFLARGMKERKLAVTLLLELSKCESMRECIGNARGCILLLVTMLSHTDPQEARDAKDVLDNLSYSDDNVILMAKSNYFQYLLERLSSGSDHVKITMAKTLGEMELTDHNKTCLVENGVLDSLLNLVSQDNVDMKIASAKALLNLSSSKKNSQEIIKKSAVRPLLDILYRQTSSQRLRELMAATIVHLAQSTIPEASDSLPLCMFESDDDISELFSFINLAGSALQRSILRAFHAMCLSPSADVIKSKLRAPECSAVQMLFRLCESEDVILRADAVNLLCCLTDYSDQTTIVDHITQPSIETLLIIIRTSTDEDEIASTLGIIGNLPNSNQISKWLLESRNLPAIFSFLLNPGRNNVHQKPHVLENAVGAISRLTDQSSLQLQKKVAEAGIIPILVNLLDMTDLTIKRAALSLAQLSRSSRRLSRQISRRNGFWCFSGLAESACPVHCGLCTVESSFCLIEANAVPALVRVLSKPDPGVCEAGLDALLTLIEDELLQNGCKFLDEENAMPALIRLIGSPWVGLQEKVLTSLERIFRLLECKQKYGDSAQMALVDLTREVNNNSLRSLAARILAQLDVIHDQSSYF